MENERCWRLRYTYSDSLTEKWNLTFDDVLLHVDNQKHMGHEFIVIEQRPGYCRWGLRHPIQGDRALCTVWTDNPHAAQAMTAGLLALGDKQPADSPPRGE